MQDLKITENIQTWLHYHLAYVSAKQLIKIRHIFGSLQQGLSVSKSKWVNAKILKPKQLELFFAEKINTSIDLAIEWSQQQSHYIITLDDLRYPYLLKKIPDPPILLYVKGKFELLSDPQIAIVGSRNASRAGLLTTEDFATNLSQKGFTITSGLASGIDSAAHKGGFAQIGQTIAVMGTGINRIYPAINKSLAHQIVENGSLISEYPLGTRALAQNFPRRNRIISGLSLGVLVVEAALKSGSLITARMAMEQGREVFAVPGSINNPKTKGCHQLIKQGAQLIETAQEILEELLPLINLSLNKATNTHQQPDKLDIVNTPQIKDKALEDKSILKYIEYEPISLDELLVLSKISVPEIQSQLMILELDEKIEALSANRWKRL